MPELLSPKHLRTASVCLLMLAMPRTSSAQVKSESDAWQYRRFDWLDAGITAAGASTVFAATFIWSSNGDVRWHGGVLFDDSVRQGLRARSRAGRDNARAIGDAVYIGGGLYPIVVDGFVVFAIRQKPSWGTQMLLIDLEAYALAGAFLTGSERVFARGRPSVKPCESDPDYEAFCDDSDQASSMVSGHTGIVATSAGLLCAHHQYLELYGNPVADAGVCALGIGMAMTTGIARLVNDRHYATDVLAGLAVGAASGYVFPVLRFYRPGGREHTSARTFTVVPRVTSQTVGLAAAGVF